MRTIRRSQVKSDLTTSFVRQSAAHWTGSINFLGPELDGSLVARAPLERATI